MHNTRTRERIINAADQLFYQQGFEHTSFSDIAAAVAISRGNFYHHFKSKDEILDAVILARRFNTNLMLEQWESSSPDPAERIRHFIRILISNRSKIKRYGCPVGTLSSELAKLNHGSRAGANRIFTQFRRWLRRQFELLGHPDDADRLALHLLARSQGVATLANAFRDEKFVRHEVQLMIDWLDRYTPAAN